jgi:LPXTG-motif cell wall-anchored protein
VHLDTDAVFESIAASAVTFSEHMDYQLTLTSPAGMASPPPITGTIERVPTQTLTAFDGTLDFLGTSAVTQPSTTRDETASGVTSADAPVLTAFTGAGTVPFHLATSISETFMGGGGNVQAQINTFVSAGVHVCYRYAPPPPEVLPESTPEPPAAPPAAPPVVLPTLPATGSTSAPLAGVGVLFMAVGAGLAWRWRAPRPRLDG